MKIYLKVNLAQTVLCHCCEVVAAGKETDKIQKIIIVCLVLLSYLSKLMLRYISGSSFPTAGILVLIDVFDIIDVIDIIYLIDIIDIIDIVDKTDVI